MRVKNEVKPFTRLKNKKSYRNNLETKHLIFTYFFKGFVKKHQNYHEKLLIDLRASSPFEGFREKSRARPSLLCRSLTCTFSSGSAGELASARPHGLLTQRP